MSVIPANLLSNSLDIPSKIPFAAIIGESPSQGARSPRLWNSAYRSLGVDTMMYPFDVSPDNLESLLGNLESNPYFVGGCVAVPYKENICQILSNNVTPEALGIGAVNAIFRNSQGELCGTNTDGEAALKSLINENGTIADLSVLILGGGGAGKSLCPYVSKAVGETGSILLACRSNFPSEAQTKRLGLSGTVKWHEINSVAPTIDILINCTSVGHANSQASSPLSFAELESFSKLTLVYDIIYDPLQTKLLEYANELNLRTLNGLAMNLEQAVLAFKYALPNEFQDLSCDKIRSFMKKA